MVINSSTPISSTNSLSGTNIQSKSSSSASDIISSFKEIMSLMTATSGMSSGQQAGFGAGDLMAPLMLLLLEKLVEQQVEQDPAGVGSQEASTSSPIENNPLVTSQGSKSEPSGRPVTGRLTQEYHPGHTGLDIAVPTGTPVKTTMDGQVVHAGWNNQ